MHAASRLATELVTQVIRHGLEPYLESTRTLVALLDARGALVAANPALQSYADTRDGATNVLDLVVPGVREYAETMLRGAQRDRAPVRGPLDLGSEKEPLRYECLIIPLERGGALLFAEPVAADANLLSVNDQLEAELQRLRSALDTRAVELQAVKAQAEEMANTDALTFLPNRRQIIGELQRQVTYSERYGTPLTISMLDLDNFKTVNDEYGHAAGDKVLVVIAKELRDNIRQPDEVGRYGGDEMLVILQNSTAAAASLQAVRLCQRIRSTSIPFSEQVIRLTLSIGITQFKPGADDWHRLLERADRALYEAKHAGGDQWVILEA